MNGPLVEQVFESKVDLQVFESKVPPCSIYGVAANIVDLLGEELGCSLTIIKDHHLFFGIVGEKLMYRFLV